MKANVEGAEQAFAALRPLLVTTDPELVDELERAFAAMDAVLVPFATADGYVSYDTVDAAGRRTLAQAADALGEPLSRLSAAALA